MKAQKMFTSMTPEAQKFYNRLFNRILLNLHAVRTGLFDALFCESDDPKIIRKWERDLPRITTEITKRMKPKDE